MVTLKHSNLEGFVEFKKYFHTLNWHVVQHPNTSTSVESNEIKDYVDLVQLNELINERISRNVKLSKLIEKDEISGALYTTIDGNTRILHLDCDSDYYKTTIACFINLNSGETLVSDM